MNISLRYTLGAIASVFLLTPTHLLAQEVEEVLPEVTITREDGYKAVRYEKLVPLLIEAIKELSEKVERLEREK